MAFLRKNALIGHRSISLQSVCAKITSSRMISVEHRSVQKLYSSAITLLKFLTYFLLVAGLLPFFWCHIHTVFIEDFLFIRNHVATLRMLGLQYRGGFHAGINGGWWWHHHWTQLLCVEVSNLNIVLKFIPLEASGYEAMQCPPWHQFVAMLDAPGQH